MKHLKKLALAGVSAAVVAGVALAPGLIESAEAANYRLGDYGRNPHSANTTHSSWGSKAWPNCPTDIVTASSNTGDKAGVRKALAPLVSELLKQTEARGYALDPAQTGGFNCRSIRGSNKPSNHSRGLAVDLNWNRNPMASYFKSDIPPHIVSMWEQAGFYWGGRYSGRPDTMHFEYIGSVASVQTNLAKLRGSSSGTPKTDKCEQAPQTTIKKGSRGAAVREAQCRLNAKGFSAGAADGIFGPKTDAAVRSFQRQRGLVVDGIVGPKTWAALSR